MLDSIYSSSPAFDQMGDGDKVMNGDSMEKNKLLVVDDDDGSKHDDDNDCKDDQGKASAPHILWQHSLFIFILFGFDLRAPAQFPVTSLSVSFFFFTHFFAAFFSGRDLMTKLVFLYIFGLLYYFQTSLALMAETMTMTLVLNAGDTCGISQKQLNSASS